MSPRAYDAPARRAAAEATRERILTAAHALVSGKGDLADLSVDLVARRAGVARMTVYYQFRSKAGLLDALMDHMATRAGMAGLRSAFMAPEPETALRRFVEVFTRFWSTERVAIRRLRAMAIVDPREGTGARGRDAWRREGVRNLLRKFGDAPDLARDDRLVDLVTMLTSFETYDQLAVGRRSAATVAEWIGDTVLALVHGTRRGR
jgi:AcrR family transcriptional regulator